MPHRKRKKEAEKKKKGKGMLLVISDSKAFFNTGLSLEILLSDEKLIGNMIGKKIGDTFDGKEIGLAGYTFKITGGTDKYGFPHHPAIEGTDLKEAILSAPPGIRFTRFKKKKRDGGYKYIDLRDIQRKKTVRGNTINEVTRQVNMVVVSRRGQSIKEMKKESILSDRVLSQLVYKLGYQILRNGLHKVRFISDGGVVRLEDKLKELGLTDDVLKELSVEVGIEFIKKGKKFVFSVAKPILKLQGAHPFAKYVGKTLYDLYLNLKEGKIDPSNSEQIISSIKSRILEGAEKAYNGSLKLNFNFKIKEEKS